MTAANGVRPRIKRAARWALTVGVAGAAMLGLGKRGWIPGSYRLRVWVSEQRHAMRIEGFGRERGGVPAGAVVFLGSSTVEGFPFDRVYPNAICLNRGVGGDTTLGLLRRLDVSLPTARPSGVVIYSGANDLRAFHQEPAAIVRAMADVLDGIAARFSGLPVALVATMPVCEPAPGDAARLRALNEGLRALAIEKGASFIATERAPLMLADGRLDPALSLDGEHLNEGGYAVLARFIAEDGGAATAALRGVPSR
ncbi:MAG: GDSL-type esterase/lipase family protein [Polyangiaceae bacterium]